MNSVRENDTVADQNSRRISVVILTFNQRQQTLRCLAHLVRQQGEGIDFQILVWDNASEDETVSGVFAQFPEVLVHRSETNLGVAAGRNAAGALAIEKFHPALLLFLDNDMVVEPGFVSALAEPFLSDADGLVGQTQAKLRLGDVPERLNDGGGCDLKLWRGSSRPVGFGEIDTGQYDRPRQCVACGGAMMVRTSLFQQLGGFDEAFNPFGPEDLDFSLRLQKAGYQAWYIPKAMAFHDVNHTFGGGDYSENYASHRARHWLRLMRKHASLADWFAFVLVGAPLIAMRVLVREGRKGNLGAIKGLVRGVIRR